MPLHGTRIIHFGRGGGGTHHCPRRSIRGKESARVDPFAAVLVVDRGRTRSVERLMQPAALYFIHPGAENPEK